MSSHQTLAEYNRLKDAATQSANRYRGEALDDFWHDAASGPDVALRAARRFVARLAHHAQLRGAQAK